jgi:hypothetical protein
MGKKAFDFCLVFLFFFPNECLCWPWTPSKVHWAHKFPSISACSNQTFASRLSITMSTCPCCERASNRAQKQQEQGWAGQDSLRRMGAYSAMSAFLFFFFLPPDEPPVIVGSFDCEIGQLLEPPRAHCFGKQTWCTTNRV